MSIINTTLRTLRQEDQSKSSLVYLVARLSILSTDKGGKGSI